jgi:hypothetical protein
MSCSSGTESSTGCSAAGRSTSTRGRSRDRTTTSTSPSGWTTTTALRPCWRRTGGTTRPRPARTATPATNSVPCGSSWRFSLAARTATCTRPLREGRAAWPAGAFENDVAKLGGARARIVTLPALKADKSEAHHDPRVAAKDRVDLAVLSHVTYPEPSTAADEAPLRGRPENPRSDALPEPVDSRGGRFYRRMGQRRERRWCATRLLLRLWPGHHAGARPTPRISRERPPSPRGIR